MNATAMAEQTEDYIDCGSDDDDDLYDDGYFEEQLSFAFMSERARGRTDADNSHTGHNDDAAAYAEAAYPETDANGLGSEDLNAIALGTPGIAIYSVVDVVEALKASGAATTYPGWPIALAYAEAQMAFANAAVNPPSLVTTVYRSQPAIEDEVMPQDGDPRASADVISPDADDVYVSVSDAPTDRVLIDKTQNPVVALMRRGRKARRPTITLDAEDAPGNELSRLKRLLGLYEDERGPCRRLLIADEGMIRRLRDLDGIAPSFMKVTGVVRRAALFSRLTGTGLVVPPVLLSGPPGVGKSFFCDQVALAIGSSMTKIAVGAVRDLAILGYEPIWKTANVGFMTKALLACDTASPIVLLDELEKAFSGYDKAPLDPLLSLLERETARSLNDNYLGIPFNFSSCIIFASVNEPEILSAPLRDRFLHVPIARPTRVQMLAIARGMLLTRLQAYGGRIGMPDDKVIAALALHHPRRAARIIELSFGLMAEAERTRLTVEDVIGAGGLIDLDVERPSMMGFVPLRVAEED